MADAYCKGIRNFDAEAAYEIALASSLSRETLFQKDFRSLRPSDDIYREKAFLPQDLSSTLEYLLADHTMANLSRAMEKEEYAR